MKRAERERIWRATESALRKKVPGTSLARCRDQRGKSCVAAICPSNHYPHRYTLKGGVACWRYWYSLEEAAGDLGIEVA